MAARRYILPANEYSGTVAGVSVSYNDHTKRHVQGLANPELKKFLEDAGVTAALSRGFYSVFIRSTPHTRTRNHRGEWIPAEMHVTVDCGSQGITAHIPVYGFNYKAANYYTSMTHGAPKWDDRATSSNVSSVSEGSDRGRQTTPRSAAPRTASNHSNRSRGSPAPRVSSSHRRLGP